MLACGKTALLTRAKASGQSACLFSEDSVSRTDTHSPRNSPSRLLVRTSFHADGGCWPTARRRGNLHTLRHVHECHSWCLPPGDQGRKRQATQSRGALVWRMRRNPDATPTTKQLKLLFPPGGRRRDDDSSQHPTRVSLTRAGRRLSWQRPWVCPGPETGLVVRNMEMGT